MRKLIAACVVATGTTTACTAQAHALTWKDPCEVFYLSAYYRQDADATPHEVGTKAMKACWKIYT